MISESKREVLKLFAEGRELYKTMDFAAALKKFEAALTVDPADGPSQVFIERCKAYIANPPEEGWDGVFTMDTK